MAKLSDDYSFLAEIFNFLQMLSWDSQNSFKHKQDSLRERRGTKNNPHAPEEDTSIDTLCKKHSGGKPGKTS